MSPELKYNIPEVSKSAHYILFQSKTITVVHISKGPSSKDKIRLSVPIQKKKIDNIQ